MQTKRIATTPLRWLGESQLNLLCQMVRNAFVDVMSEWTNERGSLLLSVKVAADRGYSTLGTCYRVSAGDNALALLTLEHDAIAKFLQIHDEIHLDSNDPDSFLARLEFDLVEAISQKLGIKDPQRVTSIDRVEPGGIQRLTIEKCRQVLDIILDGRFTLGQLELAPTLIDELVPRQSFKSSAELSRRRDGIGTEQAVLNATLGHVEVPFCELHELTVGDVLVMDNALSASITLRTNSGQPVAEAVLGRQQNHFALQVSALLTPKSTTKWSTQ